MKSSIDLLPINIVKVLDGRGYVKIIDVGPGMYEGSIGPECVIVRAARASYQSIGKTKSADQKLLRYLVINDHTSPLEMANVTFEIKAPLSVITHFLRHRTGTFNQVSKI